MSIAKNAMGRSRAKTKGRRDNDSFLKLPRNVVTCEAYWSLSSPAIRLLIDIFEQFNGHNNGDLCCTYSVLEKKGWRSRDTYNRALNMLLDTGFVSKTRQGGRNRCNLFAVTWLPINECNNKLDVPATTVASGWWRTGPPGNERLSTVHVQR